MVLISFQVPHNLSHFQSHALEQQVGILNMDEQHQFQKVGTFSIYKRRMISQSLHKLSSVSLPSEAEPQNQILFAYFFLVSQS